MISLNVRLAQTENNIYVGFWPVFLRTDSPRFITVTRKEVPALYYMRLQTFMRRTLSANLQLNHRHHIVIIVKLILCDA